MSHARCNLAARTTPEQLKAAALATFPHVRATAEPPHQTESFDGVLDFCQPRTEDLGGAAGGDAWYIWKVGPYAVLGDLGLALNKYPDALAKLSAAVGAEVVVCVVGLFNLALLARHEEPRQVPARGGDAQHFGRVGGRRSWLSSVRTDQVGFERFDEVRPNCRGAPTARRHGGAP